MIDFLKYEVNINISDLFFFFLNYIFKIHVRNIHIDLLEILVIFVLENYHVSSKCRSESPVKKVEVKRYRRESLSSSSELSGLESDDDKKQSKTFSKSEYSTK